MRWFERDGGGPAYVEGDMKLLNRIAQSFAFYSSALELPEHHRAQTAQQAWELARAIHGDGN